MLRNLYYAALRKFSKRRSAQVYQYNKRVKVWKVENPYCRAKIVGVCTNNTEDCHHQKGKIELLLLDEDFWLPVCRCCHTWIENNPNRAKDLGLSLSRLAK
jgi:hypothetical protein